MNSLPRVKRDDNLTTAHSPVDFRGGRVAASSPGQGRAADRFATEIRASHKRQGKKDAGRIGQNGTRRIELINGGFRLSVTAPSSVNDPTYGAEWSTDLTIWHSIPNSGAGSYHEFLTPPELQSSPKVFVRWAARDAL